MVANTSATVAAPRAMNALAMPASLTRVTLNRPTMKTRAALSPTSRQVCAAVTLPTETRGGSEVCVVRQLVQHEIGDVGPGDSHRPHEAADPQAVPITAAARSVGEHARPHDHPAHGALSDQPFLTRLVPEIERKNDRDHEERVIESHASGAVSDAKGRLAHEASDT